ncbi:MAG: ribonuclease Y [Bacilli bacterium]|nr:ribonuclease Y [Mycoplasmatota bacterium]MDY4236963.1 ribonuclease Y [Bacilli bacterium]
MLLSILLVIVGLIIGAGIVFIINLIKKNNAKDKAKNLIEEAQKESERIKKDLIFEAKEESNKLKETLEKEIKEKKDEVKEMENRLVLREQNMDKRDETFQKREQLLDEREDKLNEKLNKIQDDKEEIEKIKQEQIDMLSKISGLNKEKAKELVMKKVEEEMSTEITSYIKEQEEEAKLVVDKKAKELLVSSMQKYSQDMANEHTVSTIELPNNEMKGRIIGREGRNIRTIESITGVDLIIDDTPEVIVISSFDPLRREIAKITIETLIKDGRIHPTRIEEIYDKTVKEMKQKIIEYGNDALFKLGITRVPTELIEIIGKLHFRTSYGQNALQHSMEVASLAGVMAAELGENVSLAKRAGLLHDIGKAIDHEIEGSHVDIGVEIAKKYKENDVVVNAIASHHGDTESTSVISTLVQIADALSASRPGARNDSLENYIKRLEQLENMTLDIKGIEKSYALQAGRELRILVKPEEVDDLTSHKIAREIKEKIEKEMQYPGTIKVTVIRETRVTEEAK